MLIFSFLGDSLEIIRDCRLNDADPRDVPTRRDGSVSKHVLDFEILKKKSDFLKGKSDRPLFGRYPVYSFHCASMFMKKKTKRKTMGAFMTAAAAYTLRV